MSSNTKYPKVCALCGTHFTAKKLSTQFCSHRCSSHAYKQRKREEKITMAKNDIKNYCCPTKVCRDILLRSFIGQPCFVSEFIAY